MKESLPIDGTYDIEGTWIIRHLTLHPLNGPRKEDHKAQSTLGKHNETWGVVADGKQK